MNKLIAIALALPLMLASLPVAAADPEKPSLVPAFCHRMAALISLMAQLRDRGVPLREVMDRLPPDLAGDDGMRRLLDGLIIRVYQTSDKPDDLYIAFRQQCDLNSNAAARSR